MMFGITAFNAHLNALSSPPDIALEIDWQTFKAWNNNKMPQFAGRYFLGQPYLWAHGEAADVFNGEKIPNIVPIQKANKDRQEATGLSGTHYGTEDASALCSNLTNCLYMEELSLVGKYVPVFLEVEKGTKLSGEYWTAWCNAVVSMLYGTVKKVDILGTQVPMPSVFFPFLPCIYCEFTKNAAGKYVVDAQVRACLETTGKSTAGKWEKTWCRGFWARAADIPAYYTPEPVLDWTKFESFEQPQSETTKVPVPVLFWRYMVSSDPAVPGMDQFGKFTLDAVGPAAEKSLLKVEDWKLSTVDSVGNESVLTPTHFGLDCASNMSARIKALVKKEMRIRELPSTYRSSGTFANKGITVDIKGTPSFVGRYYSGGPGSRVEKDLTLGEARAISEAGIECVAFWQGRVTYEQVPDYLTSKINPKQGKLDGINAFLCASDVIMQPAHTPIYFAVDTDVNSTRTSVLPDIPYVPNVDDIVQYFQDVKEGYQQYLQDKKAADLDPVPYNIGVYGSRNVLDACYKKGLATHFWQAWPFTWGDNPASAPNAKVWPHLNIWQVLLASRFSVKYWALQENKIIIEAAGGLNVGLVAGTDGKDYLCIKDHTSSPETKPITGANAANFWALYGNGGLGVAWTNNTVFKSPSLVVGTDGNDYICNKDHFSGADTKPITGLNWNKYWVATGTVGLGVAWAASKSYKSGAGPVDLNVAWGDTGGWKTR